MKQAVVAWLIGHFMVDDQSGIGVNRRLDIVRRRLETIALAHRPRILFTLDNCGAAFGIELGSKAIEFTASGLQGRHRREHRIWPIMRVRRVGFVQPAEIRRDLAVEAGSFLGDLGRADDFLATRDRSELRTIQGDQSRREQARVPAQHHEGPTRPNNRHAVVTPEVGDRVEVGTEPSQQPHRLDIAAAFSLQASRRAHLVEIAPNVELQQIPRIVRRRPVAAGTVLPNPSAFTFSPSTNASITRTGASIITWSSIGAGSSAA